MKGCFVQLIITASFLTCLLSLQADESGSVFPYPLLWSANFTDGKSMRVETQVRNPVISIKNEDGKCRFNCSGNNNSPAKKIKLVLDGIPAHKAEGHAVV